MIVIVTGASRGIGKAIAMRFADAGNLVLINSRNAVNLKAAATEISNACRQGEVHYKACDLSDSLQASEFASWCLQFGHPEILINNAGEYLPGNCIDEENGNLEKLIGSNLYSAYYVTRGIAPEMINQRKGHIFNICSIAALDAYEGGGSYSISKFAMHGFSKNLRYELRSSNVKVTTVFPGAVFTDTWKGFDNSSGRIMEASDIAESVYCCSILSPQAVVEEIILCPQLGDL